MSGVESRVPIGLDRETSRRNFLKTAAWTGAAFSAMGIGGFGVAVRRAEKQGEYKTYGGLGDAAILQFAYQLELLESTFYAEGVKAGIFADAFLEQIVAIRDHEMAHADAIATTLGQRRRSSPSRAAPSGMRQLSSSWRRPSSRSALAPTRARPQRSRARTFWPRLSRSTTPSASTGARSTSSTSSTRRTTSLSRRRCPCRRCRRP
jgi:hypothetical protein